MRFNLGMLLMLSFCCFAFTNGLTEVDYKHKTIHKALKKAGLKDLSGIEEISMPDSVTSRYRMNGKFFLVKDSILCPYRYVYVGRVNSCRAGGCSIANNKAHDSSSEYFDYYMLFDKHKSVQKIKVFNYQATHGYEITSRGWLKQFIGYNGTEPLQVDKNIDAISGATISVYAITLDVERKTEIIQKHIH